MMATEDMLCNKLLVGVAASIHAIDVHRYLLTFRQSLARNIKVVMTRDAARMVSPRVLELYTDDRVFVDSWDRSPAVSKAPHIQLTQWAELFVVVPATADIMGKAAHGIADDLLSTCIVSYPRTVVFAPVMNDAMRRSRAVQRNIDQLQRDGHYVAAPEALGVALGTGAWDQVECPTPESLLLHLRHIRMKELRAEYWEEATRDKPLTPMEKQKQQIEQARARRTTTVVNVGVEGQ